MHLELGHFDTPIGELTFAIKDQALCALTFSDFWASQLRRLYRRFGHFELRRSDDAGGVTTRLQRYFGGQLDAFDGLAVDTGGTDFQRCVWRRLQTLSPGETRSYRDVARAIGKPDAVRAVGTANGSNPIWIVVPCHRVIASGGGLGGYGGGLERKRWLLRHEGAMAELV